MVAHARAEEVLTHRLLWDGGLRGDRAPPVREPGTVRWLVVSVALSVVLTVLLNVGLRAFPNAGRRVARRIADLTSPNIDNAHGYECQVRVYVPWKAMIIGSVVLTVVLNFVLLIT